MRSAHLGKGVVGGRLVWYQSWLVGVAERRMRVYSGSGGFMYGSGWWMMRPGELVAGRQVVEFK